MYRDGCAAWNNWQYVAEIRDKDNNIIALHEGLNGTMIMQKSGLLPGRYYQAQVHAHQSDPAG